MAVVLGINAVFHDPAAALVVDGRTVAAAEEERFVTKHGKAAVPFSTWELPESSVRWCLAEAGLRPGDVDVVTYSYDPSLVAAGESSCGQASGDMAEWLTAQDWEPLRTLYVKRAPSFLESAFPGDRRVPAALRAPSRRPRGLGLPGGPDPRLGGAGARRPGRDGITPVRLGPGRPVGNSVRAAAAALARAHVRGPHRPPRLSAVLRRVQGDGDGLLRPAGPSRAAPAAHLDHR